MENCVSALAASGVLRTNAPATRSALPAATTRPAALGARIWTRLAGWAWPATRSRVELVNRGRLTTGGGGDRNRTTRAGVRLSITNKSRPGPNAAAPGHDRADVNTPTSPPARRLRTAPTRT